MDPYILEDNVRDALGRNEGGRDWTKSAKTVMKRNNQGLLQPRVMDFTNDPLALGIRPSTAI
jgi:hypothetical protein